MNFKEISDKSETYLMATYKRLPVAVARAEGTRLWDVDGREYIDYLAGLGAVNIGHCHPAVRQAIERQLGKLVHVSNLFYTEPQAQLAEELSGLSFGGPCFFANSGAEANEGAIKLARRHAKLKGREAPDIITAWRSFHGRTMKTLAATGQPDKQEPFEPLPPGFKHVPLNDLGALIEAVDDRTCAVMLEVVQGEGGVHVCQKDYLRGVRQLCDERDILLILDEIQTGMGRTGEMFAYQHYGIEPDIMTVAKGLANGMPIGALIATDQVAESFKPGDHGSTFGGGPVVCAAASATIRVLVDENLIDKAAELGAYLSRALERFLADGPAKEIRGLGLMLALELTEGTAQNVALKLLDKGLIVNHIGHNILRFLPPLCVNKSELDILVDSLTQVLSEEAKCRV